MSTSSETETETENEAETEAGNGNEADTEAGAGTSGRGSRLTLRDAALGRPDAAAVSGVDVDVSPGEILTVVGPSGCGKSTLLRTLAGLLPPLAGTAEQDGRPIDGPGADRALVFQEDALLPWRSLRANVELPLAVQGLPRAERRNQATAWLERVGLAAQAGQLQHRVSGGQRQRAQLARALAGRPRAVLMDEPFGALDAQTRAGMQDLLVEVLHGTGATVVFVTHDVDDVLVRGAALAALAETGCPAPLAARAVAALSDPAWQVRAGAATALSAAPSDRAVPVLAKALADRNADVRKAAVLALTRHTATTEAARTALATVTGDTDADVRAYATRAL
ncbi:ATP-binding cassette domain-containing protein [Streptomyces sp. enrichment culture]|uniref:ABC transporter ATP-binding protein n=1 Tax=Streptomyces sp. enrichment culture TaxID=1795815 RepID=UPI003F571B64